MIITTIGGTLGYAALLGIGIRFGADVYNYAKLKVVTRQALNALDRLPKADRDKILSE
jgi:hypothetical protein